MADPRLELAFPERGGPVIQGLRVTIGIRMINQVRDTHERILAYTLNREMGRDFLFDEASS